MILADAHFSQDTPRIFGLDLPVACFPRAREPGFTPSNRRAPQVCRKAPKIDLGRPPAVDLSVAPLARLALGVGHRQARNGRSLASCRLSFVLDLEGALRKTRTTRHFKRSPRPASHLALNVTAHPTADWTGQQLREAFPFAQLPRYLLRDRDAIFGDDFREHVRDMGICEVLSAPRSPWQRAYIERVIGSVRRECLDHMIVLHETSLRRTLTSYFDYYHRSRTHLSLRKDAPEPRAIHPPEMGSVVALPLVGGLHHRYERRAA